ncbi:hypothetical protein GCM10027442_54220 [Emticicia fontis]
MDTTFQFQEVKQPYNVIYPWINQFSDGTLNVVFKGNIYHDKPIINGNLLVDTKGEVLQVITREEGFAYRAKNNIMVPDGKYITVATLSSLFTLQKINKDGTVDSTFRFPASRNYIPQLFSLHNGNILASFVNYSEWSFYYQIFDKNGNFIKTFQLSDYGIKEDARLQWLIASDSGEHYLYITDTFRNIKIIKTDKDLVIDTNFPPLSFSPEMFDGEGRISVYKNALYLYNTNISQSRSNVEKYDSEGNKLWKAELGKIAAYPGGPPEFYYQKDGSVNLIYIDNSHIKIKNDGTVDYDLYDRKDHQNTGFLHVFQDGSFWIMQNKSGIIEKMNADGSIDPNFKISVRFEKPLRPHRIEKQANNYLVELLDTSVERSPYSLQSSQKPNCIRIYNQKHQLLYDFFDSKTIWQCYKTKDSFVIRGDRKFYTINSKSEMSTSPDTLDANDVIDWDNKLVYHLFTENFLVRYKMGVGRDNDFRITEYNGNRIAKYELLPNKQIAAHVLGKNGYEVFFYDDKGIQEKPLYRLDAGSQISFGLDNFYTTPVQDGYIISGFNHTIIDGTIRQIFVKFKSDHTPDPTYQKNYIVGGQFVRYKDDGTIFTNTVGFAYPSKNVMGYNFMKILPSGKIDSNFVLMDINNVFGFEFFDENTLYAISNKSLHRFTKSPETRYFTFSPFREKLAWNTYQNVKLYYKTNISPIKIEVEGNARLEQDSTITFEPKAGFVKITFRDKKGVQLATQTIELLRIKPSFNYTYPQLTTASAAYLFEVSSTSNLPVKISVDGVQSIGSIKIEPKIDSPLIKVTLKSEGNDQYEGIEETLYLVVSSPLSDEPILTNKDITYYPNPARDEVYIKTNIPLADSFQLIGVDGKIFPIVSEFMEDKYRVNIKNIPKGIYILSTQSGQRLLRGKIIIN